MDSHGSFLLVILRNETMVAAPTRVQSAGVCNTPLPITVIILLLVLSTASLWAKRGALHHPRRPPPALPTATADWPLCGGPSDNTRFAQLTKSNTATIKRLRVAWRRKEGFGQFTWETFPVVV